MSVSELRLRMRHGWRGNPIRWFRLSFGLLILGTGIDTASLFPLLLGGILVGMAVFDLGCGGGCSGASCTYRTDESEQAPEFRQKQDS